MPSEAVTCPEEGEGLLSIVGTGGGVTAEGAENGMAEHNYRPQPIHSPNGTVWAGRVQAQDPLPAPVGHASMCDNPVVGG